MSLNLFIHAYEAFYYTHKNENSQNGRESNLLGCKTHEWK